MTDIRLIWSGPFDSNIYLVRNGDSSVLIDAGTGFNIKQLIRVIRKEFEFGGPRPSALVLTHEHLDHSGGAKGLSDEFSMPILASKDCAEVLRSGDGILSGASLFGAELEPVEGIEILGKRLELDELAFTVHPAPGHSKGLVCLIEEEGKALICGDLAFCDGGVGRWDLPGGNLPDLKISLERALGWDVRSLHPGHGREERKDPKAELRWAYESISHL